MDLAGVRAAQVPVVHAETQHPKKSAVEGHAALGEVRDDRSLRVFVGTYIQEGVSSEQLAVGKLPYLQTTSEGAPVQTHSVADESFLEGATMWASRTLRGLLSFACPRVQAPLSFGN